MKMIIVEDEPKTRDGLVNIIQKHTDHEIMGIAENGEEGLRKIRLHKPDLVISDIKMPVMDGLTMLQTLEDEGEEVQAILLTGYSEFEYARKALTLSVTEYLLKPVDVEEFLKILNKVEDKLEKNRIEKVSAPQLLWSYLSAAEKERANLLPILSEAMQVNDKIQISLFMVKSGSVANETITEMMGKTRLVLESICMEQYQVTFLSRDQGFLVLIMDTERNRYLKQTFQNRVISGLQQISECFCSYGVIFGLRDLYRKVLELQEILKYAFSFKEGMMLDKEMVEQLNYETLVYPNHLEQAIYREIRSGNRDRILEIGSQFSTAVIGSNASPECIRDDVVRFTAGVLRVAGELRENLMQENELQHIVGNMAKSNSRAELRHQLNKVLKAAAEKKEVHAGTENGIIINVISYIRENYSHDVTLSEAASMCGVTPEYLSSLFYQEIQVNFSSFLQNFRISMAKRMLIDGKYKISDVAESVGFHDHKYFIKVFKKICGVTPSEYKRENSRK